MYLSKGYLEKILDEMCCSIYWLLKERLVDRSNKLAFKMFWMRLGTLLQCNINNLLLLM